jgi:hypothetical protein
MASNIEAALLYQFLTSEAADSLVLTLDGNIAVQKNIRNIKDFFNSITVIEMKQKKSSESYNEYLRKYNQYIEEYAARDADGNMIKAAGGLKLANPEEFNKNMEALMTTYRDVIDEHQRKLQEWEDYVQSEYEGTIAMINASDVKFSMLSKKQYESLSVMINKPKEKIVKDSSDSEKVSEDTKD